MKNLILSAILSLTCLISFGQNLIGYNYREIQKYMSLNHQDMSAENVINSKFNYLKYSDRSDSETLLYFLNQDSVCRSIRFTCDFSIRSEKIKEFNTIYKKTGKKSWMDTRDGKNYLIEIRDEKWSSIIVIEPYK